MKYIINVYMYSSGRGYIYGVNLKPHLIVRAWRNLAAHHFGLTTVSVEYDEARNARLILRNWRSLVEK